MKLSITQRPARTSLPGMPGTSCQWPCRQPVAPARPAAPPRQPATKPMEASSAKQSTSIYSSQCLGCKRQSGQAHVLPVPRCAPNLTQPDLTVCLQCFWRSLCLDVCISLALGRLISKKNSRITLTVEAAVAGPTGTAGARPKPGPTTGRLRATAAPGPRRGFIEGSSRRTRTDAGTIDVTVRSSCSFSTATFSRNPVMQGSYALLCFEMIGLHQISGFW